jgi:hypothetical protein
MKDEHGSMSDNYSENDSPVSGLKNEASRQRWEMFHRAIAHAKQSNSAALQESEVQPSKPGRTGPLLTIVR